MPDIGLIDPKILLLPVSPRNNPVLRQALFLAVVAAAAIGGFLLTPAPQAAAAAALAGPELTHLLRAMAGLKALAAAGLVAVTVWRLASPAIPWRMVAYSLACGAMAAGPGLIWSMAHLKLGALLLHAGLLAVTLLLWRDPESSARLEAIIVRRRRALRQDPAILPRRDVSTPG